MLAEREIDGVTVGSAGTDAVAGMPVSEGSYLVGLERGIDLSSHRATPLSRDVLAGATLVLGMTSGQVRRSREIDSDTPAHLLSEYAGSRRAEDVPDPFGGDITSYRKMLEHLEGLMARVADRLVADSAAGGEPDTR